MIHRKLLIVALLTPGWCVYGTTDLYPELPEMSAAGLLGERFFSVEGGWERLANGQSDNGWGVGFEVNQPLAVALPRLPVGSAVNFKFDYRDVLDRDILDAKGVIREYLLPQPGRAFSAFLGAGFGWIDFDNAETTYLPAEAGFQFSLGDVDFLPYFRYAFAFDGDVDNFWELGAHAVFWLPGNWGLRATFSYTDYDEIKGAEFDRSIRARAGLIFAY